MAEADDQGIVSAQVAKLHWTTETVVADVGLARVIEVGHSRVVDGITPLSHTGRANVIIVGNGLGRAMVGHGLQAVEVVVSRVEYTAIGVGQLRAQVLSPPSR